MIDMEIGDIVEVRDLDTGELLRMEIVDDRENLTPDGSPGARVYVARSI